jgi:glycosyltransferase involved in cell wall biosynthesis
MKALSVIVITRNEAHNLAACLDSVPFADEIVVVDSQSTDDTRAIAARYTDRVYDLPWKGYGPAKQAALERATGRWVLSLDADEKLDAELARAIESAVHEPAGAFAGYRLDRISNFLGRWIRHSGWYPDFVLRLGLREQSSFSPDVVHERLLVDGPTGTLHGRLLHYTDPDFRHYLDKLGRYAELSAQKLHAEGRAARLSDITLRPVYQFVRSYLLQAGFLDGAPGLLLAGGSAFHVFAKYARLWDLARQDRSCSS